MLFANLGEQAYALPLFACFETILGRSLLDLDLRVEVSVIKLGRDSWTGLIGSSDWPSGRRSRGAGHSDFEFFTNLGLFLWQNVLERSGKIWVLFRETEGRLLGSRKGS